MDTPPQTAAYRRARALREEGKSLRAIADILAAESVPLPPGRATKWSHTAVVRLFRQFDTPPAARPAPPPARQRPVVASPPAPAPHPPPPAHIDRDMPPLGGPPWIPEGWRPRLLLGLLVLALLGTGGAALTTWQELQTWRGVWEVMTPAERADFNKRIRAASSPTDAHHSPGPAPPQRAGAGSRSPAAGPGGTATGGPIDPLAISRFFSIGGSM